MTVTSRPDATAQAALAAEVRRPITFCWLDILGEPVRVTDGPYTVTFPAGATGDEDLDGFTFTAVDPDVVSVGEVKAKEGGSDTLTLELSGLPGVDDELLEQISTRANWQGRDARLWKAMLSPTDLSQLGAIWAYYTGYMAVPKINFDQGSQTISLDVETYLAFFGQASNRTYLDQASFDPDDNSAALSIAIANGANRRT